MDLYEAIRLLGLESFAGADKYNNYSSKDVEKGFRQQALLHHPDKGGDANYFHLLHKAKNLLLQNTGVDNASCKFNDANSTALSTSLYEHNRTCVREVLVIHGQKSVIAATDDGLVVLEMEEDGLQRIVALTTYRVDCSFLCCAACTDYVFAGTKDGFFHRINFGDVGDHHRISWQVPNRERIVAISPVREWVAIATAVGEIYIIENKIGSLKPTIVWKNNSIGISSEAILLEEGPSTNCLHLWVGGGTGSCGSITGKLVMWKLDIRKDFLEQHVNVLVDLFSYYNVYDSDTESDSENKDECNDEWNSPAIDVTIKEGPIFSLSKDMSTIAVTAGQYIIVWDHKQNYCSQQPSSRQDLIKIKTIQTNNKILYTLCMNERFLAAAGSGESIMVWDRDLWTLLHYLPLQTPPSSCCLSTNCILTLDWFHDNSGILVSGGYDGVVTMWTLSNRLKEKDSLC